MHVIVGGCGRLGAEIATRFSSEGEDVVVIDVEETAFDRLGSTFNGETLVGNVTDRDMLERGGIETADGLLAVTRFDNANLMAVEIATHLYGVDRAVARLFNPEREASYRKLGVRYVSSTGLQAKQFVNEFREDTFRLHLAFDHGDIEVIELELGPDAHGLTIEEVEVDGRMRISAIERRDRVFIPRSTDRVETGDRIVAAARRGVRRQLEPLLERRASPRAPARRGRR